MFLSDWSTVRDTVGIAVLAYLAIIVWLRISGKRTLSQWNAFDAVVTFALGSMLAATILSPSTALVQGVAGFGVLVMLQLSITWLAVRLGFIRRFIKARPTMLVRNGRLLTEVLKRERVTEGEVMAALRQKGLAAIGDAYAVVLETSGTFSVIPAPVGDDRSALADVEGSSEDFAA